jgi:hypothetical protein
VIAPATEHALESILSGYQQAGITMFLLQLLPHSQPPRYEHWLRSRGLAPFDAQDRILRGDDPLVAPPHAPAENDLAVERVTTETADEWAEFLQRVYRLDTGGWLQALIGRTGWYQYVARRDEQIVAARAMHIGQQRIAWLGMDGPVPGLTTDDHAPDAAICAAIVTDGLILGARAFIADIEAPNQNDGHPRLRALRTARVLQAVRTHPLRPHLIMHASIWRFDGDPDDPAGALRRHDRRDPAGQHETTPLRARPPRHRDGRHLPDPRGVRGIRSHRGIPGAPTATRGPPTRPS